MARRQTRFCCGLLVLLAAHLGAQELPQNPTPAPTTPAAAAQDPGQLQSSPTPARTPGKAPQPQNVLKPVEIRANLESDTRRLSTAAKIIIGREEIERYGDSSMGELLKRGFIFLKIGQDKACAELAAEPRCCCADATGSA